MQLDFELAGYLAGQLLDRRIANPKRSRRVVEFGPLGLVRRASLRHVVKMDSRIVTAMEHIRRKACEGISSADVVTAFKCSRRMAEMRFRQIVGHSILDEIQAVRLGKAKELLSNSGQGISAIANFCGFKSPNALCKFFRQETGLSPSAWRERG